MIAEHVRDKAIEFIKEAKSKNEFVATDVHKRLQELFGDEAPKSAQSIRNRSKQLYKKTTNIKGANQDTIDDLNAKIAKKSDYIIEDDEIVMHKNGKDIHGNTITQEFRIPVTMVSDIVFDYSRHGKNMSGPKIEDKYEIKPEVWNLLKSRLHIYKASNACPGVVLNFIAEKYGEDALDKTIKETSYRAIHSKYKERYKETYQEKFKEEAKKALKTMAKIDNFLEHIQEFIQDYKPVKLPERVEQPKNNDTIDITFSDIHIGKRETNSILDRINKLTDYAINQPESNINLIFLGDLIEALVEGGMHKGQVEDMDGPYGFDLLVMTADVIVDMICKLHKNGKRVKFYGITGNHDRITEKNGKNPERTAGLVIFEMIKRSLDDTEAVIKYYREEINSFDTDLFHYVTAHKLSRRQKKAPEKMLWNNGANPDKYNIVMHGHEHTISMSEGKNVTLIGVPALAGQGSFDKKLDLHSSSGIMVIRKRNGLADILVKRFK